MNQATSYMDGSQIYGVDVDEQLKLRAGVGGKEQNSRCMKNKSCTIKTLLLLIGNYLWVPWEKIHIQNVWMKEEQLSIIHDLIIAVYCGVILKNCVKKIVCKIIWLGLGKKRTSKLLVIYLIRTRKHYISLYLVVRNVIDIRWCNFLWTVFFVYKYLLKWCYRYLSININTNLPFPLVRINEDDPSWFTSTHWRSNLYPGGARRLLLRHRWRFNLKWL